MTDNPTRLTQRGSAAEIVNLILLALVAAACITALATIQPASQPPATESILGEREFSPCTMDTEGFLAGKIFGAIERELDWRGATMLCDGMPRPAASGFRLMFSENASQPELGLRFVIGIVGASIGNVNTEHVANVTVIDQDRSMFFSTQGLERCFVKLTSQTAIKQQPGDWRIGGQLYCVGAVASVDGSDAVTLGDIEFSGRLTSDEIPDAS
jgi:hypothetical protein